MFFRCVLLFTASFCLAQTGYDQLFEEAKDAIQRAEWRRAASAFKKSALVAPNQLLRMQSQTELMMLHLRLGEYAEAEGLLQVIESDATALKEANQKAMFGIAVGIAYWQMGRSQEAEQRMSWAIPALEAHLPKEQIDRYRLAFASIYLDLSSFEKAEKIQREITEGAIKAEANFHYLSAMIHFRRGEHSAAETYFRRAIAANNYDRLAPGEKWTICNAYVKLLKKLGRKAEWRLWQRELEQLAAHGQDLIDVRHKVDLKALKR